MMNVRSTAIALMVLSGCMALVACGGGGGGGGGPRLLLSTNAVELTGNLDANVAPQASVTGSITSANVPVYVAIEYTDQGLQNVAFQITGSTTGQVNITGKLPQDIGPGTYEDTIQVIACRDPACSNQISGSPAEITVTYTIADDLRVTTDQLIWSGTSGSSVIPEPQTFNIQTLARNWTVESDNPLFLVSDASGNGPDTITVTADAEGLAPGFYSGTVTVTDLDAAETHAIGVQMTLTAPALTGSLTGTLDHRSEAPPFPGASVQLQLSTGTQEYPWQARIDGTTPPAWLVLTAATGDVGATAVTIDVDVVPTTPTEVAFAGTLDFVTEVNGVTIQGPSFPINVRFEPHRLIASKRGAALTQVNGISRLSAAIAVSSNRPLDAGWTASVEYDDGAPTGWLSVTAAGDAGDTLEITADPAGLTNGTLAMAEVVIASSTPSVVNSGAERVRVGLFVDNSLTPTQTAVTASANISATGFVADPARPYVYATHGADRIDAYHVYTGAIVGTLDLDDGTSILESLTVSDDAGTLYATDLAHGRIVVANLETGAWSTPIENDNWAGCSALCGPNNNADVDYARQRGHDLLVLPGPVVVDAASGTVLHGANSNVFGSPDHVIDLSGDSRTVYLGINVGAPATVMRSVMSYSEADGALAWSTTHERSVEAYARGFTVDYAGERLFRSCWYADNDIEQLNGLTLATVSSVASGTNGAAILTPRESVLCARYYSGFDGSPDVWEVDLGTGSIVRELNVTGEIGERQFELSSDGLVLTTRSNSLGTVTFTPVVDP